MKKDLNRLVGNEPMNLRRASILSRKSTSYET